MHWSYRIACFEEAPAGGKTNPGPPEFDFIWLARSCTPDGLKPFFENMRVSCVEMHTLRDGLVKCGITECLIAKDASARYPFFTGLVFRYLHWFACRSHTDTVSS